MKKKQDKAYIAPTKGKTKFKQFPIKQEVLSLLQQQNFKKPTVVQAQSLPITLQQNLKQLCVIVYAYNGAGKTLTFLIPILNSLQMIPYQSSLKSRAKQSTKTRPQAIIVFPTEALMSQVYEYLESYANYYQLKLKWPLKIGRIYGNSNSNWAHGHIIVGLTNKISKQLSQFDLSQLKWVVFDECDKIKDDSSSDFKEILKVFAEKNVDANFLITSATGNKTQFRQFIQQNLISHNLIQLDSKDQNMGLKGVTHYYSKLKGKDKVESVFKMLQKIASQEQKVQAIIFFNQIKQLQIFYQLLQKQKDRFLINNPAADSKGKKNLNIDYIHAKCGICKGQHRCPYDCARTKTARVRRLRNKQIQILLGTETIGRGIDIRTVSLVINFSQPKKNRDQVSSIAYIHRVGRTGRYSDEGIGLTFISQQHGEKFVKLTESQQKVQFKEMQSQSKIIQQALLCTKRNNLIQEDGKHRFEQQ